MAAPYHFLRTSVLRQITRLLSDFAGPDYRGLYFTVTNGKHVHVDTLLYSTNRRWSKLKKNGRVVKAAEREARFIELVRPLVVQLVDKVTNVHPQTWNYVRVMACIYYESNETEIEVTIDDPLALDLAIAASPFTWDNKLR